MATNIQISREDLIFQICTGPQAGQTIPVNTRKCLLQDQAQGDCAVAIFRGPQGVSAKASKGEVTLNGNGFDAAWLSNGDRLCFGDYELEVVQTGFFGDEENCPETFENALSEPSYAENSEEYAASAVCNTSSELEAGQAFEYNDASQGSYGFGGTEAGSYDSESNDSSTSPFQSTTQAGGELASGEATPAQYAEEQNIYGQESADDPMQASADYPAHDSEGWSNEGNAREFEENCNSNAFDLTPEQSSWNQTTAEGENGINPSGYEAESHIEEAPEGEPTIHNWNATPTECTEEIQNIEPASMDPWDGKFTAMETSFEKLRDQQAAMENRFDSLQEQLEMLTGSVAQLMETLTTSSYTPTSADPKHFGEELEAEGSFDAEHNWQDSTGQFDAPSYETETASRESADPAFDGGDAPLQAENEHESTSEFSAQFSRLFSSSEEPSTEDCQPASPESSSLNEERYEAIAEIDQEEVFEVEQTGVVNPEEGDDVRDRLNNMFSSLESQTSNELAFDSGDQAEELAQPTYETQATSLENILKSATETAADSGQHFESEPEVTDQIEETPASSEESESVAAVLARMQAKGTLPETSFGDSEEANELQSPFSATPEPAPSYEPEQPATAQGGSEDNDSSVQDYMNQLLGRLGNGPSETTAGGTAGSSPATGTSAPQAKPGAEPVKLLSPDEYKPSRQAPEKSANLDAMRELANMQAEAALNYSDNTKRQKAIILTSGSLTGLALAGGCYMLTLSAGLTSIPFICSVVAFGFAAFCGYRTWTSFQKITGGTRAKANKAAGPAEIPQSQPEPQAAEIPLESQIPAPSQSAPSATQEMLQQAIARAQQEAHEVQ